MKDIRIQFGNMVFLLVLLVSFTVSSAPSYNIVDLGPVDAAGYGLDVNYFGSVAGNTLSSSGERVAILWIDGEPNFLDSFDSGDYGSARAINNMGVVAGVSSLGKQGTHKRAVIWDPVSGLENLGILSPFTDSEVRDINDSGTAVGTLHTTGLTRSFSWSPETGMVQLSALSGQNSADAINASGQIAGSTQVAGFDYLHGYILDESGVADLDVPEGHVSSHVFDINDNGLVTGYALDSNLVDRHAFVGDISGLRSIGALGAGVNGFTSSRGKGINNNGYVVGTSSTQTGNQAFLWHESLGMLNLKELVNNTFGWISLEQGHSITDNGFIAGYGIKSGGYRHAFLLTEIPPTDIIVDNDGFCTGPKALWIPINYEILFFIPGSGQRWVLETLAADKYGQDYYQLDGSENDGSPEFQWSFEVPYSGVHNVEVWWPQNSNNTASAIYTINSSSGNTVISVQQNSSGGQWNTLGSFNFDAGNTYHVTLQAPAGEPVVADAIRISN